MKIELIFIGMAVLITLITLFGDFYSSMTIGGILVIFLTLNGLLEKGGKHGKRRDIPFTSLLA